MGSETVVRPLGRRPLARKTVPKLRKPLQRPAPTVASYRLRKIEVFRSDAIDQIKFTYSDDTVWFCGHDGGKPDSRVVIMTPGEYLTSVTHERFFNYRSAGAGVAFTTNKGRVFNFFPREMATKQKSELTTLSASPGREIISLVICRGVLEDIVERPVPKDEMAAFPEHWFVVADWNVEAESNRYFHCHARTDAMHRWKHLKLSGKSAMAFDVINNEIMKTHGNQCETTKTVQRTVSDGFHVQKELEEVSVFNTVKTLLQVLCERRDRWTFVIVTLLLGISSYLNLYASLLTGRVLTMVGAKDPGALLEDNVVASMLCKHVLGCRPESLQDVQSSLILAFILVNCLEKIIYVANVYVHHNACDSKNKRLKCLVFEHVLSMDQTFFDTKSESEIRGGMNVNALNDLISWNIPYIVTKAFKLLMVVYFMMSINVELAAISLVSICVIKFGVLDVVAVYETSTHKIRRKLDCMNEQIEGDAFSMIASIKLFSSEWRHIEDHGLAGQRMLASIHKIVVLRCIREFGYGVLKVLTFGAMMLYGIRAVAASGLTAADLTSFFLIFHEFQDLFHGFKHHCEMLVKQMPDIDRYLSLMQSVPTITDGTAEVKKLDGLIEFQNVWFSYPNRPGENVLQGINLQFRPNTLTAIVGDSGGGKSTIARLLMRLYDPKEGTVTIDGKPLPSLKRKQFLSHVAIVNQNPDLFGASIGANIAYGATRKVSQNEIEAAAKLANCHEFITKFRSGYDTYVGGQGGQLSGGQKQRIAIARAVIRNPKILILDEATSALDAENEKLVQDALESLMKNRTTLVIAHRLSTIMSADEIICLKQGAVCEQGTHEDLLAQKGVYANLISQQMGPDMANTEPQPGILQSKAKAPKRPLH